MTWLRSRWSATGPDGGAATNNFPLGVSRLMARDFFGQNGVINQPFSARVRVTCAPLAPVGGIRCREMAE